MGTHICTSPEHCWECLQAQLRQAQEEVRLFESLFESRCKLLEDTKRLGLQVCEERDVAERDAASQRALAEELRQGLEFYAYECNYDFIGERDCKCGAYSLKGGCWRECYCSAPADDEGEYARAVLIPAEAQKEGGE